ncbi:MAG: TetR/AcrR family transcriptional regulator [Ignavibacteria bacterium]|nr:TetR/AcrR family transcriptional regulator [Ignavibacteria bacterium]
MILPLAKERKNQIIRAAAKRFARHGLGKTTLNEVARDVRIGKATIYHYFASKEDLFYHTLEWEASQFIIDIKAIFNNEDIPLGGRLLEYFSYKESVASKYKLLFDLMLQLFTYDKFETEKEILKKLLKEEEKIVTLILSSVFSGRIESMDSALPNFITTISWGLTFGNLLNNITEPDRIVSTKDVLFKSLENILS